jgi:hypothetical protein
MEQERPKYSGYMVPEIMFGVVINKIAAVILMHRYASLVRFLSAFSFRARVRLLLRVSMGYAKPGQTTWI